MTPVHDVVHPRMRSCPVLPTAMGVLLAAGLGVRGLAGQQPRDPAAAQLRNPVASTPDSLAAGKAVPADGAAVGQVLRGTVTPTYPVIAYPHDARGGDGIAGGFVYRGRMIPKLSGKLVFGDIATGHVWPRARRHALCAGRPGRTVRAHEE